MANVSDITVKILEQIRDEIRGARTDLGARIDVTNERVAALGDSMGTLAEKMDLLARRQTETEVRLATEIVALAGAVGRTNQLLRERLDERDRVDDHEARIRALERRRKH